MKDSSGFFRKKHKLHSIPLQCRLEHSHQLKALQAWGLALPRTPQSIGFTHEEDWVGYGSWNVKILETKIAKYSKTGISLANPIYIILRLKETTLTKCVHSIQHSAETTVSPLRVPSGYSSLLPTVPGGQTLSCAIAAPTPSACPRGMKWSNVSNVWDL